MNRSQMERIEINVFKNHQNKNVLNQRNECAKESEDRHDWIFFFDEFSLRHLSRKISSIDNTFNQKSKKKTEPNFQQIS